MNKTKISRRTFLSLLSAAGVTGHSASSKPFAVPASSIAYSNAPDMSADEWNGKYVQTGFYPPVTYLLMDDLFIARKEGVHRVLCKPQKFPEPVVKQDKPWEGGTHIWFQNGVLYDSEEKVFKLWYYCPDPTRFERHTRLCCTTGDGPMRARATVSSGKTLNWV